MHLKWQTVVSKGTGLDVEEVKRQLRLLQEMEQTADSKRKACQDLRVDAKTKKSRQQGEQ